MTYSNFAEHKDKSFAQIRIQKILDYATRQTKRTDADKENDSQDIDEYQRAWIDHRMEGNARSWERWNGTIEEWEPWNRYGEPINIWRYYKLQ